MLAHLEQLQMVLTGILTFAEKNTRQRLTSKQLFAESHSPAPQHMCAVSAKSFEKKKLNPAQPPPGRPPWPSALGPATTTRSSPRH
jgi:hypothetical protein